MIPTVSEARVWTSTDGKKLEAIFESLEGDMIQLKLRNGQSVKFPVSRLIADDLEAAKRFALVGDDAMTMASRRQSLFSRPSSFCRPLGERTANKSQRPSSPLFEPAVRQARQG